MSPFLAIAKRELDGYFTTPIAYIFIVIYLVLSGLLTFYLGGFYEKEQADLSAFFGFQPWLYLLLVPAVSMRLWAEERQSGSIELLMTLPVTLWQAVLGKFLAAWLFIGLALSLTFPIWITVNYLGSPDNGAILTAYLASFLMAGAFLAIGSCVSAANRNQVVAFIITIALCFILMMAGFPLVLDLLSAWLPASVINAIANLGFLIHFQDLSKGVLELADIAFFVLVIGTWLYATAVVLDLKKAE
ncbi:MAG: ABC transporter permease [Gammaproteobacteria bacterium]|nr:ABC transporter permease [Gammaproteobacteria bacterium]